MNPPERRCGEKVEEVGGSENNNQDIVCEEKNLFSIKKRTGKIVLSMLERFLSS